MVLEIKRFVNSPVPSNTYLISIENKSSCIVIDPGSKEEPELMAYIKEKGHSVDYIILTHEHFDHCWGVNELIEKTGAKVVCSQKCKDRVLRPSNYFNKFYFDSEEEYCVNKVDIVVDEIGYSLNWDNVNIHFIETMGHSPGSMCISIENTLFTGDTIMLNTKPVLMKRLGSSNVDYKKSVISIFSSFSDETMIYPGHGEPFELLATKHYYERYFNRF
jgi:glyoxylase-like metal-dependent hydrolase (beta-lactamase superfamily II)